MEFFLGGGGGGGVAEALRAEKTCYFQKILVSERYHCPKKFHISFNAVSYAKIQIAALREEVDRNYNPEPYLEKREFKTGEC